MLNTKKKILEKKFSLDKEQKTGHKALNPDESIKGGAIPPLLRGGGAYKPPFQNTPFFILSNKILLFF